MEDIKSTKGMTVERMIDHFGLTISSIEDNSVVVSDSHGNEVGFAYPLDNIPIEEYDKWVEQMRSKDTPLPRVDDMELVIHKPIADSSPRVRGTNAATTRRSWADQATYFGVSVDELLAMYRLAQTSLYERYKNRLRGN